ncbi:MAG: hypothetical protein ORN27_08650 [Rhodoluna sp.]|jgi:hypothetical protein|nr:hypothetical protein [Rhodoluna sp.]
MSDLNEVGERDGWRCWLCDQPVDPDASVNSDLGPSTDSYAASKAKKGAKTLERLAHRQCNTMKGKVSPVVAWSPELFVVDPSPIFEAVERLERKGGREIVARCPGQREADEASEWLIDRLSRLAPGVRFEVEIKSGGGQFMLALKSA